MGNWVRGNVKFISKDEKNIERLVNNIKFAENKNITIGDIPDHGLSMCSIHTLKLSDGYYGVMFWVEYHKWSSDDCLKLISDEYDVIYYLSLWTEGGFDTQYELYYNNIRQYSKTIDNTFWMHDVGDGVIKLQSEWFDTINIFSDKNTESIVTRFLNGDYIKASECKIITHNDVQKITDDGLVYLLKEDDIDTKIGARFLYDIDEMFLRIDIQSYEHESLYDIINDLKDCI